MIVQSKKEKFLQNKINKLERAGCSTDHTKQDADMLIVQAEPKKLLLLEMIPIY